MTFSHIITDPKNIAKIDYVLKYKKPIISLSFEPCVLTSLHITNCKYLLSVKLKNRKVSFKDKVYIYEAMNELKIKIGEVEKKSKEYKVSGNVSEFFLNRNTKKYKESIIEGRDGDGEVQNEDEVTGKDALDGCGVLNLDAEVSKDIFLKNSEAFNNLFKNISLYGIKFSAEEKNEYFRSLNIQCCRVIRKYLDTHEMDYNITFENKILKKIRNLLKKKKIGEIEQILGNMLANHRELVNEGPYEIQICLDNNKSGEFKKTNFYFEDENSQKIVSYDTKFMDLIKISRKDEIIHDTNLSTLTNFFPLRGISFFTLENVLYIVKNDKILHKVIINELKWISNHKMIYYENSVLLVGGSRKLHGVEEYNTIIEIKLKGPVFDETNATDILNYRDKANLLGDYEIFVRNDFYPRSRFDAHLYGDILILIGGKYGKNRINFIEYYHLKFQKVVNQVPFPVKGRDIKINSALQGNIIFIIFGLANNNLLYAYGIEELKWDFIGDLEMDLKESIILGFDAEQAEVRNNEGEKNLKCQVINLATEKPTTFQNFYSPPIDNKVYGFYVLKESKRYKLIIKRERKEEMLNQLIIRLRSYNFLLNYDLKYAQEHIFPLLKKNEAVYRLLMIMCYTEEKMSFGEIYEAICNFFTEEMRMPKENIEDLFK